MASSDKSIKEKTERSPGVKDNSPTKASSSAERVVDSRRKLLEIYDGYRLFTDSQNNLLPFGLATPAPPGSDASEEEEQLYHEAVQEYKEDVQKMGEDFLKRILGLEATIISRKTNSQKEKVIAEGQSFVVNTRRGPAMVFVKHNFCNEINEDGIWREECLSATVSSPKAKICSFFFGPELLDWSADKLTEADRYVPTDWKYGNEGELVPVEQEFFRRPSSVFHQLTQNENITAFDAVDSEFELKVEMVVGILAYSCTGVVASRMEEELYKKRATETWEDQSGLVKYAPQKGDTFLTVGKITKVKDEHIEYDVNTVAGFSGAPVFLLAPGEDYHMKVIAVHAGFSEAEDVRSNFGFLIADKINKWESE